MDAKFPHFLNVAKTSDSEATIDIFGDIGQSWFGEGFTKQHLKDIFTNIGDVSHIKVNISSFGGSLDDGLAIHDMLKQHPAKVTTNVYGFTASSATVIAQAGNVRQMSENAMYLIHKPMTVAIGNENEIGAVVQDLEAMTNQLIDLYKKSTGMSRPEVKALINENNGNGRWLTPDEAKTYGLVDKVFEPSPKGMQNLERIYLNTYNLPDLPMENNKNEAQGLFAEIRTMFSDILAAVRGTEKDGKIEDVTAPEAVTAEQLTEIKAKIEAAETRNAELSERFGELETENATLIEAQAGMNDQLTEANNKVAQKDTEILALKEELTKINKAGAKGTHPGAPVGKEDGYNFGNSTQNALNNDLQSLKDRINLVGHETKGVPHTEGEPNEE